MSSPRPYHFIPLRECGESLVPLSPEIFALANPHPYVAAGASYGTASPWLLRRSVAEFLLCAQQRLQKLRPGWKILLMDAYRPLAVQKFMSDREWGLQAAAMKLDPENLSSNEREKLSAKVFSFWCPPNEDPAMPPPHSTGAAFDCTLLDENGKELDMGSAVDENSERAMPDYYALAADEAGRSAHENRTLLHDILRAEGFARHKTEWWHFSQGDQLAVWVQQEERPKAIAIYGRADLI